MFSIYDAQIAGKHPVTATNDEFGDGSRKTLRSHLKRPRRDFARRIASWEFREARHRHKWKRK
jgi:hypothetical protein